jgi:hypothetical protein
MLGKLAADALGLSDIGKIIPPKDYDKVDTDDYVLHEEGEKIYFLIKSKMDEYCFTNLGLIHLDGASAVSKKRLLKRYNYYKHTLSNVALETAGTVDLDIEIKFTLGSENFSIDVTKNQLDSLKLLYKALLKISSMQYANDINYESILESLAIARDAVGRSSSQVPTVESFKNIYDYALSVSTAAKEKYFQKDFSSAFEKYLGSQQK